MKIDPSRVGNLPKVAPPSSFTSKDGRMAGWRMRFPTGRPLATPAVAKGRVFVGGGFGSYEFYALDAEAGQVIWQYQTSDDGPTAAVVEDDYVVFNTESCELEVLTTAGESVWKRWLGDPLMSMPAVGDGRVFMAYPDSRGNREHHLACFDLKSGEPIWKQQINGEIITAPILADTCVYLSTLAGTLCCFRQMDGHLLWQEAVQATSAPVVREAKCYYSQREEVSAAKGETGTQQTEQCAVRGTTAAASSKAYRSTNRKADYLDHRKRAAGSRKYATYQSFDAKVGFAASKGDAKLHQAMHNLGQAHVSGVWSYQGSKPFISGRHLFAAIGDAVHSLNVDEEELVWKTRLRGEADESELLDTFVAPPCLVNDKVFVGTSDGEICCLAGESGQELWRVQIDESIAFQPAVANGRIYVPTESGNLFCLKTEDAADDGWLMWGATASHNGLGEGEMEPDPVGAMCDA